MEILVFVIMFVLSGLSGVLLGLIPYFLGKSKGKPKLGEMGWLWTSLSGLLGLQIPVVIGFVIVILTQEGDYASQRGTASAAAPPRTASMAISCLSGPMKGRTYNISGNGIMIGRDIDCAIRFDAETPGISRHHCALRFEQDALMLTDLNSAYGTYLADGRRLPPQYPTQVFVGSRFYLGDKSNLFQIILTV